MENVAEAEFIQRTVDGFSSKEYDSLTEKFEKCFQGIITAKEMLLKLNNVPVNTYPNALHKHMTEASYRAYYQLDEAHEDLLESMRCDFGIAGI